jgi:hypothetical protein
MFYKLGRAGRRCDRFGAIDFATTIAPGVRDVLLTGKVYEAVAAQRGATRTPASTTPSCSTRPRPAGSPVPQRQREVAGLAKVGPIKTQADNVMALLRSPQTAVHLVTVLEEMPVQETADGIAELRAAGLPVGGVVVNLVREPTAAATDLAAAAGGPADRAPRSPPAEGAPGSTRRRRWSTALLPRRRARRAGRARGRPAHALAALGACRRTSCRGCPTASTSAALYELAGARDQGLA